MSTRSLAPASPWPEGVGRVVLDTVDSTMAEAARRAPGLDAPTWIMARRQTAPRGRRGRVWIEPEGNFAATLVHGVDGGPAEAALRSFVAALALSTALSTTIGAAEPLSLKWPNDVLLNGRKVAGILLETHDNGRTLLVGIGVNLRAAPPRASLEAGALAPASVEGETGIVETPEAFLAHLATTYGIWEAALREHGFGPIKEIWLAHAARLGTPIVARTAREEIAGIFETVDDRGHLVLRTPTGLRQIAAADVFFG